MNVHIWIPSMTNFLSANPRSRKFTERKHRSCAKKPDSGETHASSKQTLHGRMGEHCHPRGKMVPTQDCTVNYPAWNSKDNLSVIQPRCVRKVSKQANKVLEISSEQKVAKKKQFQVLPLGSKVGRKRWKRQKTKLYIRLFFFFKKSTVFNTLFNEKKKKDQMSFPDIITNNFRYKNFKNIMPLEGSQILC